MTGLDRLRRLCPALPEAHEVKAWGEPTFRVRNRMFAMYAAAGHHHCVGRAAVWLKAAPGNQALMIAADPDHFFMPPYAGPSGWVASGWVAAPAGASWRNCSPIPTVWWRRSGWPGWSDTLGADPCTPSSHRSRPSTS